jgi:hypothetical protein
VNDDEVKRVRARLDALNAQDPSSKSLAFSDRLEKWVMKLNAQPSAHLQIAVRGQHVRRWVIPRSEYPEGRSGYLRWREELKRMHARTVTDAMRAENCTERDVSLTRAIVQKQNLAENPDAQTMEDALCLVFLESQLEELSTKTPDEKMIEIVRKTWQKMSDAGRKTALALAIPSKHRKLIDRALS